MMRIFMTFLASAGLALAAPASAEVRSADERGFAVAGGIEVEASTDDVWAALLDPSRYWNPDHSWSLDAENFSLEPVVGGCFCETVGVTGGTEHMRVIGVMPGRQLVMRGSLGPLQSEALTGTLTITLQSLQDGKTGIGWSYVVGGYARYSLNDVAPAVDGVVAEQMSRLAALFE